MASRLSSQDAQLTPSLIAHRLETSRRGALVRLGPARAGQRWSHLTCRLPLVTALLLLLSLMIAAVPTASWEPAVSAWQLVSKITVAHLPAAYQGCCRAYVCIGYFLTAPGIVKRLMDK